MDVDVERLREVFGSLAHGTARPDSDIDLLYTLAPGKRLGWAIEDLNQELATILGRSVDLVSRRALNARLRDRVLAEAQTVVCRSVKWSCLAR